LTSRNHLLTLRSSSGAEVLDASARNTTRRGLALAAAGHLRLGFVGAVGLAATEMTALVAPFIRVNRIEGLGNPVAVGTKAQVLGLFSPPTIGRSSSARPLLLTPPARWDHRRVSQVHTSRLRRAVERLRGSVPLPLSRIGVRQAHRRRPEESRPEAAAALSHHREHGRRAHRRYEPAPRDRSDEGRLGSLSDRDRRHIVRPRQPHRIAAMRRSISRRTIGATFVPKSSIERSTFS